jgi:hypothetical protein
MEQDKVPLVSLTSFLSYYSSLSLPSTKILRDLVNLTSIPNVKNGGNSATVTISQLSTALFYQSSEIFSAQSSLLGSIAVVKYPLHQFSATNRLHHPPVRVNPTAAI